MKYTLSVRPLNWKGVSDLPNEIHTLQSTAALSEFELLAAICGLHGFVCAFDLLMGAEQGTEKDADLEMVLTAFQSYLSPKMPLSMYSQEDTRIVRKVPSTPPNAMDASSDIKLT